MNDYRLFGWLLRSAIALPELLPCQDDGGAPDIVITIGPVPPIDPHRPQFSPAIQIGNDGVRIEIPAVASYWVEGGRSVIVEPFLPENAPDIRVFLLGTVLAALCFQRGLLPLHASAVDIGGRALLITGNSGAGKSTLAAAFSARGYPVLSDDLCLLDAREANAPVVHPSFPRIRLWRNSAEQLHVPVAGLERSRAELEKFHVPLVDGQFQASAMVPGQIVFLKTGPGAELGHVRTLAGLERLRRYELVHRWRLGLALGQQAAMFASIARLHLATPAAEVTRTEDLSDLPTLVDAVLALVDARPR